MRYRMPIIVRLALVLALAGLAYLGGCWSVSQVYPLEYRPALFYHARLNGIDPHLVAAVIRAESHFRPGATSSEGARGLMQIMPETGEWVAGQLKLPYDPNRLYEPEYNIRLGCWYLASLRREFGGDTALALAAYNAGRSNVRQWVQEKRWTGGHDTLEQIPFPETRIYVSRVLRDYQVYRSLYQSDW